MKTENALKIFHDLSNVFISSPFGNRDAIRDKYGNILIPAQFHNGVDYGMNGKRIPVYAFEDGKVLEEGIDNSKAIYCYVYYPRLGYVALYYHLTCTYVSAGDSVNKDTKIGKTGNTGKTTGVHLHLCWFKYSDFKKAFNKRTYEDYNKFSFPKEEIIYVVKPGDYLSKIARMYSTTWQKIYENNRNIIGPNPNYIKSGQRLVIK